MSQESQVNLNFADYDRLGLRLFAISISPQSKEKQVWPVGCLRAGCKIGRYQKWQRRLILKNQTVCTGATANEMNEYRDLDLPQILPFCYHFLSADSFSSTLNVIG